jgi:hypothetical protein
MASTRSLFLVMVCLIAVCTTAAAVQAEPNQYAECGEQAYGALCLFGACCSKDGMCGYEPSFCGNGCQSGPCERKGAN